MLPFDDTLPYPSQREPVYGKACVATSQPLAAQAGLDILRRGGNAADAAVATAMCLTVVEPTSNGIGSDAFALVWAGGGLHGLNASGMSPALLTDAEVAQRFEGLDQIPFRGWGGVTVPGAVSAWAELVSTHGTMPLAELAKAAVHYARNGYLVSPQTASGWSRSRRAYAEFDEWQRVFAPGGKTPRTGQRAVLPDHANTLESIGDSSGESFYKGHLAEAIDKASTAQKGLLRASDLGAHEAQWVRPISVEYHGLTLHEIPPNGQGLAALIALGFLRHHDVRAHAVDSALSLHLQIETMKLAFRDAHRYIADPRFMGVSADQLLDPGYLAERASHIRMDRATDFEFGVPKQGGTVYLTTADADGMMVSYIQSNYTGFGSGVVVPGTGISLQNRGCCFSLEPGHPNLAGPVKRPYHTIIPGFVTRDVGGVEEPVMSFGVMGGFMQPQGHAQVVIRIADYGQNPQAALDAPRYQVMEGLEVLIEPGFDDSLYDGLRELGHEVEIAPARTVTHGRGQIIYKLDDGYLAASDLRSDGQAVCF